MVNIFFEKFKFDALEFHEAIDFQSKVISGGKFAYIYQINFVFINVFQVEEVPEAVRPQRHRPRLVPEAGDEGGLHLPKSPWRLVYPLPILVRQAKNNRWLERLEVVEIIPYKMLLLVKVAKVKPCPQLKTQC